MYAITMLTQHGSQLTPLTPWEATQFLYIYIKELGYEMDTT